MAQFFASIRGSKGEATRLGGKPSGMTAVVASWRGAVEVYAFHRDGKDCLPGAAKALDGRGESRTLAEGVFGEDE